MACGKSILPSSAYPSSPKAKDGTDARCVEGRASGAVGSEGRGGGRKKAQKEKKNGENVAVRFDSIVFLHLHILYSLNSGEVFFY